MLQRIVLILVKFYQLFISPLLGTSGKCLYQPTCSQYCKEAIKSKGLFYGSYLSIKRILSCHPACTCGVDPIPQKLNYKEVNKNESN